MMIELSVNENHRARIDPRRVVGILQKYSSVYERSSPYIEVLLDGGHAVSIRNRTFDEVAYAIDDALANVT